MSKAKMAEPPQLKTRDKQGRFLKGVKGSGQMGGGRPKLRAEFKQFAQEKSLETLKVVWSILIGDGEKASDRLTAARIMLEYGYGRPAAEYDRERLALEIRRTEMDEKKQEAENNENAKIEVIISNQAKEWGE
jgi:hypothetical protein